MIAEIRELKALRDDPRGWLYFIQQGDDGPIKIGHARSPRRRLGELQPGSSDDLHIVAACEDGAGLESEVHAALRDHWIRGEWYDADAVLTFLVERWRVPLAVLEEAGYVAVPQEPES